MTPKLEQRIKEKRISEMARVHNATTYGSKVDFKAGCRAILSSEEVQGLVEALERYAKRDDWADFTSDGNIFNEQDGDTLSAFNCEHDSPYREAEEALAKFREIAGQNTESIAGQLSSHGIAGDEDISEIVTAFNGFNKARSEIVGSKGEG